jgi:hypothetical protein
MLLFVASSFRIYVFGKDLVVGNRCHTSRPAFLIFQGVSWVEKSCLAAVGRYLDS